MKHILVSFIMSLILALLIATYSNASSQTLIVEITGAGNGSVHSSPLTDIACMKGASSGCIADLATGSVISLSATPDSKTSVFNGWSNACSTEPCNISMNSDKNADANFSLAPVCKLNVNALTGFKSLAEAYSNASSVMFAMDTVFAGDWILDENKDIVLTGGYQADYTARSGFTILGGALKVRSGTLRVSGLKVQPTGNVSPVANAGNSQYVTTNTLVTLDGSASSDANGDLLTFTWSFLLKPDGSSATLSNISIANPTFTPDVKGSYTVSLVVNDGKGNSSVASVTVTASAPIIAPVANAGTFQDVATGTLVTLDGSASSDANGDLLTYTWSFLSKPNGSNATLSSTSIASPTFIPDIAGSYTLNLVVNDGKVNSTPSMVTVKSVGPNFNSMIGVYDGISNSNIFDTDSTDITVSVVGTTLKITDKSFFAGTCIYSGTITGTGNGLSAGTYQCSDFTTGSWSLLLMKIVDANDIYISILKDGISAKRLYGMSAKSTGSVTPIVIENISSLVGTYSGISNGGPFTTDSTDITVNVIGSTLKITDKSFFAGTCLYSGTISGAGNSLSAGTYQCSDFTTGSWSLLQMKAVDANDIYISILKDGTYNGRMYGW